MSRTLVRPDSPARRSGSQTTSARLPSLDGWRAISIVLVLGSHSRNTVGFPIYFDKIFQGLFDGNLGVRMFFVLSGFLITWLLLQETEQTGRVDLPRFYIRRALRILPVYGAFVGVLILLTLYTPYSQPAKVWWGIATFTNDLIPGSGWTSGHLWSLANEERFYLVWPGLFIAAGIAARPAMGLRCIIPVLLFGPIARTLIYFHTANVYIRTLGYLFSFVDSLALGCAGAVLLQSCRPKLDNLLRGRKLIFAGLALVLIGGPELLIYIYKGGMLTVPFGNSLQGLGMIILLLQSVLLPRWGFYSFLNLRPICYLGALSYSLYIWQEIFCTPPSTFGLIDPRWFSFRFWLIPVFAVALGSYYFLERPFFRLRRHFR